MRIAIGFGWTTLVAAEMVAATVGLGQMVLNASNFLRTDVVIMGIVVIGVVAYLFDLLMRYVERLVVPWKGKVVARARGRAAPSDRLSTAEPRRSTGLSSRPPFPPVARRLTMAVPIADLPGHGATPARAEAGRARAPQRPRCARRIVFPCDRDSVAAGAVRRLRRLPAAHARRPRGAHPRRRQPCRPRHLAPALVDTPDEPRAAARAAVRARARRRGRRARQGQPRATRTCSRRSPPPDSGLRTDTRLSHALRARPARARPAARARRRAAQRRAEPRGQARHRAQHARSSRTRSASRRRASRCSPRWTARRRRFRPPPTPSR